MFWKRTKRSKNKQELSQTNKAASTEIKKIPLTFLKRLIPIGHLPDAELEKLQVSVSSHIPGDVIFKMNDKAKSLPYLAKGLCYIEMMNGAGYEVDATTFKAFYPLSNTDKYQCTIIAKSDVKVLHFPLNALSKSSQHIRNPLLNSEDIPEQLQDNRFFDAFCQYFKQDKLIIPCLPDVALKLREAIQKDIGVQDAVKIINCDSVISSRLIQAVNSPLYRGVNPITSSHDAVARLGLATTRSLVTSISIQNLFKSKNIDINLKIHGLWKKSIQVSSISYTLAMLTKKANPDEALLAGLTHNIGAIPILIFADTLDNEEYSDQDLNMTISALQGPIGSLVLKEWGFPQNLQEIPKNIDKWYCNEQEALGISDIVLLAKFHSFIGGKQIQKLPPIQTLPAFQKIGDNELTPDMSLQTLHDAKQQIAEAMCLFKA